MLTSFTSFISGNLFFNALSMPAFSVSTDIPQPYDLLEIDYGRLYIPFVKALVKEVKLEEGKVIVDESLSEV